MKIIYKIARAELRTIFYSPIAWLVILAFYATIAAVLMISMEKHANMQEALKQLEPGWMGFDGKGVQGFTFGTALMKVYEYIYLFVPLLTMGLINRELVNGTSKLLYSSPVTVKEIVLGKFLGMTMFNLLILSLMAFVMYSFCLTIEVADYTWVLSILLGFMLVMSAFTAIGLFLSAITNYQIVAAMLTFVVFFLLSNSTRIGQQYDLIRDITFALAMGGKGHMMLYGLITSRDVIYFLMIIFLFIGFTIIKLESTQQSVSRIKIYTRYSLITLVTIVIGCISSSPQYMAYLDVTKNKNMTIQPVVQEALQKMDGSPLTVTLYTNLLGINAPFGLPQARNLYQVDFWEPYIRFYPNTVFKYEYYYDLMEGDSTYYHRYPGKNIDEIAAIEAEIMGIRTSIFKLPEEIRKQTGLGDEKKILVMQLEYKDRKTFLRTYQDANPWPSQHHVAAGIMRLTRDKEVKAIFATGHYERSAFNNTSRDYFAHTNSKAARGSLINNGVDADTISLLTSDIKSDADVLIVADPKTGYTGTEQQKIINWLNSGGNAILFTEPGKQHFLAPVLKEIGIYPDNGIIVRPDKHEMPILFKKLYLTKAGNFLARERDMQRMQDYGYPGASATIDGAVHLNYTAMNGFVIEPVITLPGNDNTWIENSKLVADSAAPVFSPAEGDTRKPEYVTVLKLSRTINGKEQRVIVTGDADFMSARRTRGLDIELGLSLYSYTLNNQYPAYANPPLTQDRFLKISHAGAKTMVNVYVYGISVLILLISIIILVRRKRK